MKLRFPLAVRLTLMYAGIFTVSSCAAFVLFYYLVAQTIGHRMDQDLMDKAGAFEAVFSVKGMGGVRDLAVLEARASGEKKAFFRLLYPSGEVFASSHMSFWQDIRVGQDTVRKLAGGSSPVYETVTIEPGAPKVRILYARIGPGVILQTGLSMETYAHFFQAFKTVFAGTMTLIVVLSAASGWFLSRRALAGVQLVINTAQKISGTRLSDRVPETGTQDELDHLARTFNTMLVRIEILVTSMREMTDNIAHDLKSPIARIRGLAEVSLTQDSSREDLQQMAASTIEESDRLLDMINTMLVISRTDSGEGGFRFEPVDITDLVAQACDLFEAVAEDKGIGLVFSASQNLVAMADTAMLQRAVANIIDNALKYTPSGGSVAVSVEKGSSGALKIRVADTGHGILPQDLNRIFDRFYRGDPSRSQQGSGLGLSLVKAVVSEHGGSVEVTSAQGQGSTFLITLPIGNVGVI
ncbi:MAG: ATP-binding protein [Pseudomonadota bacterium]